MAVVLDVQHEATGEARALKLMLPRAQGEAVARRFRREYRTLSRIDHPGVLKVYEIGSWNELPYLVMERLSGVVLKDAVEEWRELGTAERFARAESVLVQVASALDDIHRRGLVHRDVTPGNIMLLPDGSVRLMDFGVVKEPGAERTTDGEVVGTAAYIAPEQIQGGKVDGRADLYALGAVLYLMLTGRRPFNARTLAGYMDKHLHRAVRPPRELVPTIPTTLDEVCVRLLEKDPADRFSSAAHLLHALGVAPAPSAGGPAAPLVGRTAEVAQIRDALARLAGDAEGGSWRRGGVVIIEGHPGMGRARLAEEVALTARSMGLPFSRARSQAPGQPAFSAFRGTYTELVTAAGGRPSPALQAAFHPNPARPERVERWAVMAAMAELIGRAGPRVFLLEALDQADRPTIELTEYLIRNLVGAAQAPLLFVISRAIPGESDPLSSLVGGESTGILPERITLGPLPAAAVEELLLSTVEDSEDVRVLAERLHREGDGNPFLIAEMIRGLRTEGVLAARPGRKATLTLAPEELQERPLPVPSSVRHALIERLLPLPPAARRVAEVLAVARQELDLDALIAVTGLHEDAVLAGVEALSRADLLIEQGAGCVERFELARNRGRDVIQSQMSDDVRADLHRALGNHLERQFRYATGAVVENLAHHFEAGERPAKALTYLMRAAEKLATRTFIAEALSLLDRALSLEPDAREQIAIDEADHRLAELRLQRAQALFHLGRWAEGESEAHAAHDLAQGIDDDRLRSRIAAELAVQIRRLQRFEEAEAWLQRALKLADKTGDKRLALVPLYERGALHWARGDLETAHECFVTALANSEALEDERGLALGYNGLGLVALCRGASADARRHFEAAIEVSERHGLMDRLSVARTNLVEVFHLTGNIRKGMELAERAIAHAREVGHPYGMGLGLRYRAMLLADQGRIAEAIENAEEALRTQQSLNNPEEALTAQVMLLRALMNAGELDRASEIIESTLPTMALYDTEGFGPLVLAWRARIHVARGEPEAARADLATIAQSELRAWPYQQARLQLNIARVREELGERAVALQLAEDALRLADACGYRFYALRARLLAARVASDEAVASRHARVADALSRSLAANLDREDAETFLSIHGVARER